MARPSVLFVCVRNAGRSQMAAALLKRLSNGRIEVRSAGTQPAEAVHREVLVAMRERGIDLTAARPTRLEDQAVRDSDVVVTMGCGDACPVYPGKRYEEWELPDPAGKPLDEVRAIRDRIEDRVRALIDSLA